MLLNLLSLKELDVAEMRMLTWMCGIAKLNRIKELKNYSKNKTGRNILERAGIS